MVTDTAATHRYVLKHRETVSERRCEADRAEGATLHIPRAAHRCATGRSTPFATLSPSRRRRRSGHHTLEPPPRVLLDRRRSTSLAGHLSDTSLAEHFLHFSGAGRQRLQQPRGPAAQPPHRRANAAERLAQQDRLDPGERARDARQIPQHLLPPAACQATGARAPARLPVSRLATIRLVLGVPRG